MNTEQQTKVSSPSALDKAIILVQALRTQEMLEDIGDAVPVERDADSLYLCTIVELAFCTGMHPTDIKNLKWPDINLEKWKIRLDRYWRVCLDKYDITQYLALNSQAVGILERHYRVYNHTTGGLYVFPSRDGEAGANWEQPFEEAVRLANISNFSLDDLRLAAIRYITTYHRSSLPSNADYYSSELFEELYY